MMAEKDPNIGYMWNIAIGLGEGQSLTLAGNFLKGESKEHMDFELDKVMAVVERQRARLLIPIMEEKVAQAEDQVVDIQEQIGEIQSRLRVAHDRGKPVNGSDDNNLKQLAKNLRILQRNIEVGRNEIALKRAVVGQSEYGGAH